MVITIRRIPLPGKEAFGARDQVDCVQGVYFTKWLSRRRFSGNRRTSDSASFGANTYNYSGLSSIQCGKHEHPIEETSWEALDIGEEG